MFERKIYIDAQVIKKFEIEKYRKVLETFMNNPTHESLNLEKLQTSSKLQDQYSIRFNKKSRIILCPINMKQAGQQIWVVTHILENHEYQKLKKNSTSKVELKNEVGKILNLGEVDNAPPITITESKQIEYINRQYIYLDDDQQSLKETALPLIINGAPGCGKTSTLLATIKKYLLGMSEKLSDGKHEIDDDVTKSQKIIVLTKSQFLVKQMRDEWIRMCEVSNNEHLMAMVDFETPESLYLKNNPGFAGKFLGEEDFVDWYKAHYHKNPIPCDLTEAETARLVYQEFYTISGYDHFDEYCSKVKKKLSFFSPEYRQILWEIYTSYRESLNTNHVDLAFEEIKFSQEYDLYNADEGQDLSGLQLRSLVKHAHDKLILCFADHQVIYNDRNSYRFAKTLFHNHSLSQKTLHASYRCAPEIADFANVCLQLKYYATGGTTTADKKEISFIKSNTVARGKGTVSWIEDRAQLQKIAKNNLNNIDFVVITSPEKMQEAIKEFGVERVFTSIQIKGLERKTVVLYDFLDQKAFEEPDHILKDEKIDALQNESLSIPKTKNGSVRHNKIFNELFVACTRSISDLMIYQSFEGRNHNRHLKELLKNYIVQQSLTLNLDHNDTFEPIVSTKEETLEYAIKLLEERAIPQAIGTIDRVYETTKEPWLEEVRNLLKKEDIPQAIMKIRNYQSNYEQAKAIELCNRDKERADNNKNSRTIGSTKTVNSKKPKKKQQHAQVSSPQEPTENVPANPQGSLEIILESIAKGEKDSVGHLFDFRFETLPEYNGLSKEDQLNQNLPAIVFRDYLLKNEITTQFYVTAFVTYIRENKLAGFLKNPSSKEYNKRLKAISLRNAIMAFLFFDIMWTFKIINGFSENPDESLFIKNFRQYKLIELIPDLIKGNVGVVTQLVRFNILNLSELQHGRCPLHFAVENNHINLVKALLAAGADINKSRNSGVTPLITASEHGQVKMVEALIAQPNIKIDEQHYGTRATALYLAAQNGYLKVVELLLAAGADINKSTNTGVTPLIAASEHGQVEMVKALLAQPNIKIDEQHYETGANALYSAVRNRHLGVVELLVEAGADINKSSNSGVTPLIAASEDGQVEMVKALLAQPNIKIDEQHYETGATALYLAAQNGYLKVVERLLAAGANVNIKSKSDVSAAYAAIKNGHAQIAQLLVKDNSFDPNIKQRGTNLLAFAIHGGHVALVKDLLSLPNIDLDTGTPPIYLAILLNHIEIVKLLNAKMPTPSEGYAVDPSFIVNQIHTLFRRTGESNRAAHAASIIYEQKIHENGKILLSPALLAEILGYTEMKNYFQTCRKTHKRSATNENVKTDDETKANTNHQVRLFDKETNKRENQKDSSSTSYRNSQ